MRARVHDVEKLCRKAKLPLTRGREFCFGWKQEIELDERQGWQCASLFGLGQNSFEVTKRFINAERVAFAACIKALFDELLEMTAGDLRSQKIGDDLAGAALLLIPCLKGQGDPDGLAIDLVTDIDRIGVAGGNGHHVGLPDAVQVGSGPAIGDVEILVHALSVSLSGAEGKPEIAEEGSFWS